MTEDGGVKFGILGIWCILLTFLAVVGYLYLNGPDSESALVRDPTTQINNTTVINNYYCNLTEPIPEGVYVQDYVYNETTHEVENITCAAPSPTPALWNDTRRESVGLPKDGIGNNCCKHCTPTPTPTVTEACEFPWWCRV